MGGVKTHLMHWAIGKRVGVGNRATAQTPPEPGAEVIVLDHARHVAPVLASDLATAQTVIFAPFSDETTDARVVPYEGSFAAPGAEAVLGNSFFLQIQNYAISEFMSVVGPTLVRVSDDADLDAYLKDADRAVVEGVFPAFLTHPVIQLADLPGLGAGLLGGPSLRLHVRASGEVSTSPSGIPLGDVGTRFADIESAWERINGASSHPCAVCLGDVLDSGTREAGLAQRPWLARYLVAIEAIRNIRARGVEDIKVSGFGGRIHEDLSHGGAPNEDPDAPVLLWNTGTAFVYAPGSGRAFQASLEVARLAELLLVRGGVDAAADHAPADVLRRVEQMFATAGLTVGAASRAGVA